MVMMGQYPKKVVEAYKALSEYMVRGARGYPPLWPVHVTEVDVLRYKFLHKEIYLTIKALEEKQLSKYQIGKLFWGPSAITHILYGPEPVLGLEGKTPVEGLTRKEGIELVEKVVDIISLLRKGDPYCRDGKNLLLSANEVEQKLAKQEFIETSNRSELADTLGKINTMLWHYCLLIQAANRTYSEEFHGPYELDNGENLLIREYFNLKPTEIWQFTSAFPYEKITIFEIYSPHTEIRIDLMNHYWFSTSPSKTLLKFSILANDSQNLNSYEVQNLFKACVETTKRGELAIKDFTEEKWLQKVIEVNYRWMKPAKEFLGKEWKPPSDLLVQVSEIIEEAREAARRHVDLVRPLVDNLPEDQVRDRIMKMYLQVIYGKSQ